MTKISGRNIVVEVDKLKFGKQKCNFRQRIESVWIVRIVEKMPEKRIVLVRVKNKNGLPKLLVEFIKKDIVVHTECW